MGAAVPDRIETFRTTGQFSSAAAQEAHRLGTQVILQTVQWLPGRKIIGLTDSNYAVLDLLKTMRRHICIMAGVRLDARPFDSPAQRRPEMVGHPRVIGSRQVSLAERPTHPKTWWRRVKVTGWRERGERIIGVLSGTALWHHPGRLVPIRYITARDLAGELRPQAHLRTDLEADPVDNLQSFVQR